MRLTAAQRRVLAAAVADPHGRVYLMPGQHRGVIAALQEKRLIDWHFLSFGVCVWAINENGRRALQEAGS